MNMTIPYGRQDITDTDIEAVLRVLRGDFLTTGPEVPLFEQAVAARVSAKHGVAVNSATSALHVACLALGLGPGDVLWTVPNSFVASANCARYCGADVDFVDIDPRTWNMSVSHLRQRLETAERDGCLPRILVPVHFSGQPTDQSEIHELATRYGVRIIEDASHSIGATRGGEPVGSCRWSDITVFSFHPVKIVTTAEGGMAVTNDSELALRMAMLRSHGITRDAARFEQEPAGPWYYEQQMLGFNYRLTDLQAALGSSQLSRLDEYIDRRNALALRYDQALQGLPLLLPTVRPENRSAFHIYVVRVDPVRSRISHRSLIERFRAERIEANVHYMPIHLQPYYRALGFVPGQFPEAEAHGDEAVTLPLYPGLSDEAQSRIVNILRDAL
jgi:UDP-4-amino-4,6-dideoxy-N-acetyl-beta-L-altrosamine transaminase